MNNDDEKIDEKLDEKLFDLQRRLESNFNFELTSTVNQIDSDSEFLKELQKKLAARIQFFINSNMDKLLHALYRIDIKEKDVDAAFDLGEVNKVSMKLAELIIVRQLQKLDYARKFYQIFNEKY